jgi:hypothetical protein
MALGSRTWAIAEGYIPAWGTGPGPEFTSHETNCILNASDEEAQIELTVYFTDRDPAGPYRFSVPPRRTRTCASTRGYEEGRHCSSAGPPPPIGHQSMGPPRASHQSTSNRPRFMTLSHAATKSRTNFSLASSLA